MRVLIAGDYCPKDRISDALVKDGFEYVLGDIKPIVSQADYAIVNLECPICYGSEEPIQKIGPNLKCLEKGMEAVRWSGFDCVTLANNHFSDYGEEGIINTLNACRKNDLDAVGGGVDLEEASRVFYKVVKGKTLAIINCCEHEFSIASKSKAGSNPLNPIRQYYAIKEARNKADYILVIVHGGHEMWQLPSPRMQETYRFFIDAGADAVVNHHQHCFSGYEYYKGRPILYGLGNFCFDEEGYLPDLWCYGFMVCICFPEERKIELYPYKQCAKEPKVTLLHDRSEFDIKMNNLNKTISSFERLQNEAYSFWERNSRSIYMAFEPYSGRILRRLYMRGLLPSFMREKRRMKLLNMFQCESHRDMVLHVLKKKEKHE